MSSRRHIIAGMIVGLAAPYILRGTARAATPLVRRDVMDLSDTDRFFSDYAAAVKQMHQFPLADGRSWMAQARIHADYCHHSFGNTDESFLPWHRNYLRFFESICAKACGNPDFALPY